MTRKPLDLFSDGAPSGPKDLFADELPQERGNFIDKFVGDGLLMGFGDEIRAGVRAPVIAGINRVRGGNLTIGEAYNQELEDKRADVRAFEARNPKAALAAELLGGAAGVVATGGGGLAARGSAIAAKLGATSPRAALRTKAALAGAEGAGFGAVQGFAKGEGEEGRIEGARTGAIFGAAGGAALQGIAGKIATRLSNSNFLKNAMNSDQLKELSQQFYRASEQQGIVIKPEAIQRGVDRMIRKLDKEGLDRNIHREIYDAIEGIVPGNRRSIEDFDNLRKAVGDLIRSPEAMRRRGGAVGVNAIDRFIKGLRDEDIAANGNLDDLRDFFVAGMKGRPGTKGIVPASGPQGLAGPDGPPKSAIENFIRGFAEKGYSQSGSLQGAKEYLSTARKIYHTKAKSDLFETALERAKDSAMWFNGKEEQAIRTQMRSLLRSQRANRTLNKDEISTLRSFVRGGADDKLARLLSNISPTNIGPLAGLGLTATVNPALAAALGVAGFTGRKMANTAANREVELMRGVIASLGTAPQQPLRNQKSLRAMLQDALLGRQQPAVPPPGVGPTGAPNAQLNKLLLGN